MHISRTLRTHLPHKVGRSAPNGLAGWAPWASGCGALATMASSIGATQMPTSAPISTSCAVLWRRWCVLRRIGNSWEGGLRQGFFSFGSHNRVSNRHNRVSNRHNRASNRQNTFFVILASAFRHVKHYVIGKLHRRNHVCSKKTWTRAQARRMRGIPSEFCEILNAWIRPFIFFLNGLRPASHRMWVNEIVSFWNATNCGGMVGEYITRRTNAAQRSARGA